MSRRPSGFTLIELMVAVTIIGMLASIALPAFHTFQLRARQAERALVLPAIHRSIEDYFLRTTHFPSFDPATPSTSTLWLSNNPGATPVRATLVEERGLSGVLRRGRHPLRRPRRAGRDHRRKMAGTSRAA